MAWKKLLRNFCLRLSRNNATNDHRLVEEDDDGKGDTESDGTSTETTCIISRTNKNLRFEYFMELPEDTRRRIVDYLSAGEALCLSRTSKLIRSDLSFSVHCPPQRILRSLGQRATLDSPKLATKIHIATNQTHSIQMKCKWHNPRGVMVKLYVLGYKSHEDRLKFDSGRLVALAPVEREQRRWKQVSMIELSKEFGSREKEFVLAFNPRADECYSLWYAARPLRGGRVGYGQLFIHALVYGG